MNVSASFRARPAMVLDGILEADSDMLAAPPGWQSFGREYPPEYGACVLSRAPARLKSEKRDFLRKRAVSPQILERPFTGHLYRRWPAGSSAPSLYLFLPGS